MSDRGEMVVHGTVVDPEIDRLRKTVQDQRREIAELQNQLDDAQRDSGQTKRALASLRKSLSPVYKALQMVFGDIEMAGVTDEPYTAAHTHPTAGGGSVQHSAVWEAWKHRMPGYPAKVIDALLTFGEKSAPQLAIAVGCRRERIYEAVAKLKAAGVLIKNGDNYSLKQL
jgi:biotin operon repressor